jgi:hypothetical protein
MPRALRLLALDPLGIKDVRHDRSPYGLLLVRFAASLLSPDRPPDGGCRFGASKARSGSRGRRSRGRRGGRRFVVGEVSLGLICRHNSVMSRWVGCCSACVNGVREAAGGRGRVGKIEVGFDQFQLADDGLAMLVGDEVDACVQWSAEALCDLGVDGVG